MIDGYCRGNDLDEALQLRDAMEVKGLCPGIVTYNSNLRKLCAFPISQNIAERTAYNNSNYMSKGFKRENQSVEICVVLGCAFPIPLATIKADISCKHETFKI